MELFSVICETCRARLKVRSASAVGEIHACPKCGSMVQIAPPPGWTGEVASATGPGDAADAHAPNLTFAEPTAAPLPGKPAAFSFAVGAVGAAALLLIGGLAIGLWRSNEPAAADPATIAAADPDEAVDERDSLATPADNAFVPSSLLAADEAVAEETVPLPLPEPPALPELPSEDETASDTTPAPATDLPALPPLEPRATPPADRPQPTAESRKPKLTLDPFDFDPARLSLATPAGSAPSGSVPDDNGDGEAALAAVIPDDSAIEAPPPDDHDLTLAMRLGPTPDVPAPDEVASQLALSIGSLEITDMPLARFVELIAEMANVPITLDPVALELAGVSPRQAVSVRASGTTLEDILGGTLAKLRLEYVERDGQIIVNMAGGDQRRSAAYDVGDLAGDASHLAELVQRFVAPETWQPGDASIDIDGPTLRIDHRQSIRHEVLIFCERLRLARGLPPRSRYPASLLSIEPAHDRAAILLNQTTTFTFLPWERLADVLRRWQDESGLTILVDWAALAELELVPSSPVSSSAIERTWEEVLDATLEPLGLAWWAIDGETIQITTGEALDESQRIEFYAVPEEMRTRFADATALMETLQAELRSSFSKDETAVAKLRFELDELSGCLIVAASPRVHRQLASLWRGEADHASNL